MDWVVCWNRVMACGISNQYFLSFITVTWTAHSILIENNLIKNLTVKRDWELWMRLLVRIHQLELQLSPGISELGAARAGSCRGGTLQMNTSNRSPLSGVQMFICIAPACPWIMYPPDISLVNVLLAVAGAGEVRRKCWCECGYK